MITSVMATLLHLSACASSHAGQADTTAMIEQAKKDAAAESAFTNDSVAFERTFEVKPLQRLRILQATADGGTQVSHYYALSVDGKMCQVTEQKYRELRNRPFPYTATDTLRCQWSERVEQ